MYPTATTKATVAIENEIEKLSIRKDEIANQGMMAEPEEFAEIKTAYKEVCARLEGMQQALELINNTK